MLGNFHRGSLTDILIRTQRASWNSAKCKPIDI